MALTLSVDERAEVLPIVEGQIDALLDVTHGADAAVVERAVSLTVLQLTGAMPLAELFLDELEGRGAAAAASFAAVAALGPPPLAERATATLADNPAVVRGRIPDGIGALSVTETFEVRAPGTVIQLLRLERRGDARWHAASVLLEEGPGGVRALVAASLATAEAGGALADMAGDLGGEPGVTIARIDVATARSAIERAAVQTGARDLGVGTETAACLPIIGRALGIPADVTCRLPAAAGPSPLALPPDDEDAFSALRETLLDRFTVWLGDGDPDGMLAFVADVMLGFRFFYGDGDVGRWTEDDVAELMLDHVPRKLDLDTETVAALVPGVTSFLTFLDASGDLSGVPVAELCATCEELLQPCLAVAGDESSWGPAKRLTAAMAADGVDLGDDAAVQAWIAAFNAGSVADRDAVLGPLPRVTPVARAAGQPARPVRPRKAKRKAARAARRRNR
jgi:hypothetical protein